MGTTYRFIADPCEPSEVLAWFRTLPSPPEEIQGNGCLWLFFSKEGPLARAGADGAVDPKQSPVATVFIPRVRRGVLWTVGEVHFLATPLRQRFPGVHKVSSAFGKWLSGHECVFSNQPGFNGEWSYYLQGSVKNFDPPVFALPSGFRALKAGQYFVAEDDTVARLDEVCSSLRLRGIHCSS